MPYGQRSILTADESVKPLFGLSLPQLGGAILAIATGLFFWWLAGLLPFIGKAPLISVGTELRILVSCGSWATLFTASSAYFADHTEPIFKHYWAYLWRPHRLAPPGSPVPAARSHKSQRQGAPSTVLWPGLRGRKAGRLAISPDGILTLPDGSLRQILSVSGVSLECMGRADQEQLAAAFSVLGSGLAAGQRLQLLVESRPINAAAILRDLDASLAPDSPVPPDYTDQYLSWLEGQLEMAHCPDKRFFLVVSPAPTRRVGLSLQTNRGALEQTTQQVERLCKAAGLSTQRLQRSWVLHLLWSALNPTTPCPPLSGAEENLLEVLLQTQVQEDIHHLQVDGMLCRSLYLLAPPEETDPGFMDPLVSLDAPCRLAIHLEGLDKTQERRRLKRRRRQLTMITTSARLGGQEADVDTELAAEEALKQLYETRSSKHNLFRVGVYLTVFAPTRDDLAEVTERAESAIQNHLGALLGRGMAHQLPLFQSTLPLGMDTAEGAYRWLSGTFGNAIPYLTHSPGMKRGYPLGFTDTGHEFVNYDPSDPSLHNGIMNIAGRPGTGKTFLALSWALYTLLCGGRVTVVDRAGHYEVLRRFVGGSTAMIGDPADPPALNMWDYEGARPDTTKVKFIVDAHEVMLATNPGDRLTPFQAAVLEEGIRAVYSAHDDGTIPLERELVDWLEAEQRRRFRSDRAEAAVLKAMAYGLRPFVRDGTYASFLDRPTSVDLEAPMLVFDLAHLGARIGKQHGLALFMITEAVERRAQRTRRVGERAARMSELVIVDEGWFLLRYAPGGGAWIERLGRQGRHMLGMSLLFITQRVSDLVNDPVASSFFNAAGTQFILRQNEEGAGAESGLTWLARTLRLSDEEVRQIQGLSTVSGAYSQCFVIRESKETASTQRGIVNVITPPENYWLFLSDPHDHVVKRAEMIAACGGHIWPAIRALVEGRSPAEVARDSARRIVEEPLYR